MLIILYLLGLVILASGMAIGWYLYRKTKDGLFSFDMAMIEVIVVSWILFIILL